jgi:hypothetical protein
MAHHSDKSLSKEETISSFEQEIARQNDIVYGAALFFECLSILHADQPGIVETHRKQFRNIIQNGTEMNERASALLQDVKGGKGDVTALTDFEFKSCQGHANPGKMTLRALALAATYKKVYPGRDRSEPLMEEETLRLLEEASATITI